MTHGIQQSLGGRARGRAVVGLAAAIATSAILTGLLVALDAANFGPSRWH